MSDDDNTLPESSKDSNNSTSEDETEVEDRVESLVTGRAKRATAGNRLSSLVDKEQDDEIELLFAENEQEEDESFDEDEGDASDANLDSSSDEEDKDGAQGQDDLAGEKELQKRDQQEKRKRKAKEMSKLPGMRRKRVKIDPTAITSGGTPQPRLKKKSERVSWIASAADAPTRVSSRKQTVQNREVVHQRLVSSEKQRLKIMRQMEEAQKRKDASRPKALTQAQRLEEAARMERKNAQSLNRWEESEKERIAEQKAKLEALHSRQLTGPVISWWSGLTRWVNGKISQLGVKEIRDSGYKEESVDPKQRDSQMPISYDAHPNTGMLPSNPIPPMPQTHAQPPSTTTYSQPVQFAPPQGPFGFLGGIHAYAALPAHQQRTASTSASTFSTTTGVPNILPYPSLQEIAQKDEYCSRCLVALKSVDANAQKLPEMQNSVLVKKQKTKLQKASPEPCAITGQPAKYREPKTGLPYANTYAFKEIERLGKGGARWSNLLDCYVGPTGLVARGVPERFRKPA